MSPPGGVHMVTSANHLSSTCSHIRLSIRGILSLGALHLAPIHSHLLSVSMSFTHSHLFQFQSRHHFSSLLHIGCVSMQLLITRLFSLPVCDRLIIRLSAAVIETVWLHRLTIKHNSGLLWTGFWFIVSHVVCIGLYYVILVKLILQSRRKKCDEQFL